MSFYAQALQHTQRRRAKIWASLNQTVAVASSPRSAQACTGVPMCFVQGRFLGAAKYEAFDRDGVQLSICLFFENCALKGVGHCESFAAHTACLHRRAAAMYFVQGSF